MFNDHMTFEMSVSGQEVLMASVRNHNIFEFLNVGSSTEI